MTCFERVLDPLPLPPQAVEAPVEKQVVAPAHHADAQGGGLGPDRVGR